MERIKLPKGTVEITTAPQKVGVRVWLATTGTNPRRTIIAPYFKGRLLICQYPSLKIPKIEVGSINIVYYYRRQVCDH